MNRGAQLPKLFSTIPVVVYVLERAGDTVVPVWVSENITEFFGYSVEDALAVDWWTTHIHADDRQQAVAAMDRLFRNGTLMQEYRFLHQDGRVIHVRDQLRISPEDPTQIVGAWTDITDRVVAEEALRASLFATAEAMSRLVEARDPYTAGHQQRVGAIAAAIADELGYGLQFCKGLEVAGALHDVGKVRVPGDILTKPGRLTPPEFELVKEHAQAGYEILKGIAFPWPVAEVARQHHERIDGSGYPRGLKGDDILIEARIIAIADVVESMSSHRPYRAALGIDRALAEIEGGAGVKYDADAAAACVRLFRQSGYRIPDGP